MSLLRQYKGGSLLFRFLAESRHLLRVVSNTLRFKHPAPKRLVAAGECGERVATGTSTSCVFPEISVSPSNAGNLLNPRQQIEFPPAELFAFPQASVLGDGAVLVDGGVALVNGSSIDFHRFPEHHQLLGAGRIPEPIPVKGRWAVVAVSGGTNYFHWTLECLPRLRLLREAGVLFDRLYLPESSAFQREWLELLGIEPERVEFASSDTHVAPDEVLLPLLGEPHLPTSGDVAFLQSFMNPVSASESLYISRARARRRRVVGEAALQTALEANGFRTVLPGELSVQEQMQTFASAKVIVAAHGAELTNLVYCQPGTKVVELFSPKYLNPCFRELAGVCGLQYRAVVGGGGDRYLRKNRDLHHVWANINVTPSQVMAALEGHS